MLALLLCLQVFIGVLRGAHAIPDYSLVCRKGYRLSALRRLNSAYQKNAAGSLNVECERILSTNLKQIQCETLESTPQCNGWPEGCTGSQWLAGFHAYSIENATNSVLLDPVCCSSPSVRVDSLTCATERLNQAKKPFEHRLLSNDLIYRGMQCWNQYNSVNTIVDLVWKMEICQFRVTQSIIEQRSDDTRKSNSKEPPEQQFTSRAFSSVLRRTPLKNADDDAQTTNNEASPSRSRAMMMMTTSDQLDDERTTQVNEMSALLALSSNAPLPSDFSQSCPPCVCHCGIDLCASGAEPIRITHKANHPQKCSCDCACKYECI